MISRASRRLFVREASRTINTLNESHLSQPETQVFLERNICKYSQKTGECFLMYLLEFNLVSLFFKLRGQRFSSLSSMGRLEWLSYVRITMTDTSSSGYNKRQMKITTLTAQRMIGSITPPLFLLRQQKRTVFVQITEFTISRMNLLIRVQTLCRKEDRYRNSFVLKLRFRTNTLLAFAFVVFFFFATTNGGHWCE